MNFERVQIASVIAQILYFYMISNHWYEHPAIPSTLLSLAKSIMASTDSDPPCSLLLLPVHSPASPSLTTLRTAYGKALKEALKSASKSSRRAMPTVLDIAVAYDNPSLNKTLGRVIDYVRFQQSLGSMYRLMCIICAEESIDIEYDNDVDARVIFVDATSLGKDRETQAGNHLLQTPLTYLEALAVCHRPWRNLYSLESENGEKLLQDFLQIRINSPNKAGTHLDIERLAGGLSDMTSSQSQPPGTSSPQRDWKQHSSVAVGGTFDHLHAGHKLLLTVTALLLDRDPNSCSSGRRALKIGITGDELLRKKKYLDQLQEWNKRQAGVGNFLVELLQMKLPTDALKSSRCLSNPESGARTVREEFDSGVVINYVEIFDAFGPTITDESISALVVSGETRSGGQAVNDRRKAKGWSLLEVFEVDVLDATGGDDAGSSNQVEENYEGKISSTEIRRRLHNRAAVGH